MTFNPSQPRDETGKWTSDGSDQSASQSDDQAKQLYAALLGMPPEQRDKFLAGLSNDQLTRLSAFASTGKATDGPIADIRNRAGQAMAGRGLDPAKAGLKSASKGKKAGAKKGGKSGGGGSKGGGGKSSGGGKKSGGGGSKGGGSKSSGSSSRKSSSSKSSGSKSSSSSKAPAAPKAPKPAPTPPPPPAVSPVKPGTPRLPSPAPGTSPVSRPAGRVGKRRRRPTP